MKHTVTATVQLTIHFDYDPEHDEGFDTDELDITDNDTIHDYLVDEIEDQEFFLERLNESHTAFTIDRAKIDNIEKAKPPQTSP